jgi:hypothetical protein
MFQHLNRNIGEDLPAEMLNRWQREATEWEVELAKVKRFERDLERFERDWKAATGPNGRDAAIAGLQRAKNQLWPDVPTAPQPREVKR